jgi:hypothetical protein
MNTKGNIYETWLGLVRPGWKPHLQYFFFPSKQCEFGFPPMTRAVSWVEPSVRSHNYAKGNVAFKDVDN